MDVRFPNDGRNQTGAAQGTEEVVKVSWYENKKRYHKERYRKLIESGTCVRCTKKPAVEGKRYCPECQAITNEQRLRYYYAHREALLQVAKERKERLKAEGRCTCCGSPTDGTRQECDKCSLRRKLSRWRKEMQKEAQA